MSIALSLALCYVILAAFSEIDEPRSKISSVIEAHAALVKVEFLAVLFSIGNVVAIFLLAERYTFRATFRQWRRSSFWKAYASWLGSRALAFLLASVNAISVVGDELVGDQHGTIAEQSRSLGAVLLLSIYLFAVSFRLGTRSYNLWKQLPLSSGDEVLAKDSRPRIVYMRSFRDDAMEIPAELARPVLHSYEVALVSGLKVFGPCVAIGRPGEQLPELGFAKIYAAGDQWRDTVLALLAKSQLVVLNVLSFTEGFQWELEQTLASIPLSRVVLMFPWPSAEADREPTYAQAARNHG